MIKILMTTLVMILITACNKDATTPEGLLTMFIKDITTKKLDHEYFEKYTTGKLLESVEQLNADEFEKFSNLSNIKDPQIKVTKKNCSDQKCTLTYIVKYDHHVKKAKEFESEVKKLATLVKSGETWKIEEVSNLKTFHEAVNPITVE